MPDCAWWDVPCLIAQTAVQTGIYGAARERVVSAPEVATKTAVDAAAAALGVQQPAGQVYEAPAGAPASAPGVTPQPATGTMVCRTQSERSGGSAYWRDVQRKLCTAGYDPGRIDGRVGTNTRSAIRQLQSRLGITQSGQVDRATAIALNCNPESTTSTGGGGAAPATDGGEGPETPSGITQYVDFSSPVFWGGLAVVLGLGIAGFMWLRRRQHAAFMARPLGPEAQLPAHMTGTPDAASATAANRRGRRKRGSSRRAGSRRRKASSRSR